MSAVPPSPIPLLRVASHQVEPSPHSFVSFTIESSLSAPPELNVNSQHASHVVTRRRRYREFERLREDLRRGGFPQLDLPGKLLVHSASAMQQRRKQLETSLVKYVEMHGSNPVLDTFLGLGPRTPGLPGGITPGTPLGGSSVVSASASTATGRRTDRTMSEVATAGGADDGLSQAGGASSVQGGGGGGGGGLGDDDLDDDDGSATSSQEEHLRFYMPYPLELLAARAVVRGEGSASKRVSLVLACLSVATSLVAILVKRRGGRFLALLPLDGVSLGFAASSFVTMMLHSIPARRSVRHVMGMFGLDIAPEATTNADDVATLINKFKYVAPSKSTTSTTGFISRRSSAGSAGGGIGGGVKQPEFGNGPGPSADRAQRLDMLDALNGERRYFEAVTQARLMYADTPNDVDLAWRLARALYYAREVDGMDPKEVVTEGLQVITRALDAQPDNAQVLKFVALLKNAAAQIPPAGTGQRIEAAIQFEKLVDKALKLDPNDSTLWYMMGRFNFDLASLGWMERRGAKALYGAEPPAGSFEQALVCFEKSHALKPTAATFLKVGESLQKLGRDKARAQDLIRTAAKWEPPAGTVMSNEDERCVHEARKLV